MENKHSTSKKPDAKSREGQGYNDARGEVPDKKDVPAHNGQNLNNDPKRLKEKQSAR